ncbi:MAG: helix-turn-helix transcriptional regulator [Burkholderiales bacterium]|nr:helix-turn-helix transcriptional regulator [Burkholderiales bacterium]
MNRSYGQPDCPVARALEAIGERWSVLLLRELFLRGSRRFQDFLDAFPGMGPNTLSTRLKELEDQGLVERRLYEDRPPRMEYVLTERGRSVGPVMKALRTWGTKLLEQESDN